VVRITIPSELKIHQDNPVFSCHDHRILASCLENGILYSSSLSARMIAKKSQLDKSTPLQATEKNLYSRKFWTFGILSATAYLLLFSTLFLHFFALRSMIYVLLFFLFFHFFYLEIRKLPIKYFIIFMLAITVIQ